MRHFLVCYDGQVVAQAACASASFMGGQFSLPNHVSVEIHKTPGTASESFDVLFHVTQKESDSDDDSSFKNHIIEKQVITVGESSMIHHDEHRYSIILFDTLDSVESEVSNSH